MSTWVDPASNLHPYECNGPGSCIHCDRIETDMHDPRDCQLCAEGESVNILDTDTARAIEAYAQGADPMTDEEAVNVGEVLREAFETSDKSLTDDVGEVLHEAFETRPVAALADTTRVEAAHTVHARAVRRIQETETQLRAAFADLIKAQNLMKESGIEIVTRFSRPIDSAWAAWKNEQR